MVNEIVSIISQVGFPIAACGAMAWYVKYITDQNIKQSEALSDKYVEALAEVKEALYQQTAAISSLSQNLGKGTTDGIETLIRNITEEHSNQTSAPFN